MERPICCACACCASRTARTARKICCACACCASRTARKAPAHYRSRSAHAPCPASLPTTREAAATQETGREGEKGEGR